MPRRFFASRPAKPGCGGKCLRSLNGSLKHRPTAHVRCQTPTRKCGESVATSRQPDDRRAATSEQRHERSHERVSDRGALTLRGHATTGASLAADPRSGDVGTTRERMRNRVASRTPRSLRALCGSGVAVAIVAACLLTSARASLIFGDRSVSGPTIEVNAKDTALVQYRTQRGTERHVLTPSCLRRRRPGTRTRNRTATGPAAGSVSASSAPA